MTREPSRMDGLYLFNSKYDPWECRSSETLAVVFQTLTGTGAMLISPDSRRVGVMHIRYLRREHQNEETKSVSGGERRYVIENMSSSYANANPVIY